MKRGLGIALFCICFCALFLVCALWRGLTLRFYRLETDKLTEDARLRLVLLTDLHSAVYGEGHRELLDLVLDQRPDAILLGGDIVDDVAPLENALSFFAALSRTGLEAGRILGFEGVSVEGLDVVQERELVLDRLTEAGRRILGRTCGQVLVLGCLIFLGTGPELEERLQVPVLDAAALSVGMAELLVRQNISSSRKAYPAWKR